MTGIAAIHSARRHVGHERDGSDAISFVLGNTQHYMAVDRARALADAIYEAIGNRPVVTDADERVTLLSQDCDEQSSIFSAQINDLADRVTALEFSICHCRDCEMHRKKSRPAPVSAELREILGKALAKHKAKDADSEPCRYACSGFPMCGCEVEALNPPEPAAPVQDAHNTAGHAGAACLANDGRPVANDALERAATFLLNHVDCIGFGEASETVLRDCAEHLSSAGFLASTPQTVTRNKLLDLLADFDRARDGTHYGDLIDKHFPHAPNAEPQPLTIDWNAALDAFHAASRGPHGTASDGVMAVLKLLPGLKVEG